MTNLLKLDIDKLVPLPVDLCKLSNVLKNYVVKKKVFDKLVAKVNDFDTSRFVLRTKYTADKSDLEKKISDADNKVLETSGFVRELDYHAKITKIEGKIPSITSVATISALTAVESKIPDVSSLVKKIDYDAKISNNESKYITTVDYNTFASNTLDAKIKQKRLVNEFDLNEKTKTLATKEEVKTLATKAELNAEQDKIKNLETYDLSFFIGQSYPKNDGAQLYLIFKQSYKTIATFSGLPFIISV